jgi:hypothetical protein
MRTSLFCHLDDIAAGLDMRALRQRGVTALTANVLYHDWVCFAPMSQVTPLHREAGGVSDVPVRGDHPQALRPAERRRGTAILAAAADAGLALDAWTVSLHRDDLARRFDAPESPSPASDLVTTDAFGGFAPWWVCPSSEDAARYLEAHLADIAAAGLTRTVLEGCHYPLLQHGSAHERDLARLPAALRRLLEICFCPACLSRMAAAGLDAEAWRADVAAAVRSDAGHLAGDPRLAATGALRRARITELFVRLRAAHPGLDLVCADQPAIAGAVFRTGLPSAEGRGEADATVGFDLAALAAAGIRIMCLAYFRGIADVVRHVSFYLQAGIPAAMLSVALRPGHPDCIDAADLVAKARAIRALGVTDLAFYELTQLQPAELDHALAAIEAMDP